MSFRRVEPPLPPFTASSLGPAAYHEMHPSLMHYGNDNDNTMYSHTFPTASYYPPYSMPPYTGSYMHQDVPHTALKLADLLPINWPQYALNSKYVDKDSNFHKAVRAASLAATLGSGYFGSTALQYGTQEFLPK
jgi:hypothetical protein